MSLDERLFALALKYTRRLRLGRAPAGEMAHAALLAPLQARLTLVARALSGASLDIREAEECGGFVGDVLYVPRAISLTEDQDDNVLAYLYRVAYSVTSRQLGYALPPGSASSATWHTLYTLLAVPPTLSALEAELPQTRAIRQRLFPVLLRGRPPCARLDTPAACLEALTQALLGSDPAALWPQEQPQTAGWQWLTQSLQVAQHGHGMSAAQELYTALLQHTPHRDARPVPPVVLWGQLMPATRGAQQTVPQDSGTGEEPALPSGTERRGKPKDYVRQVSLDEQDIANDILIHTFDKTDTAEEFCGVTRTPDGADELVQHAEALDELDLRDVVRSRVRTQSLYRADVLLETDGSDTVEADATSAASLYDEWDGKARQYKQNWCSVYMTTPLRCTAPSQALAYAAATLHTHAKQVRDLRAAFDRIRCQRVLKNRQPDGADIDIDAVVERYATVRSGHQPDDRLYLAQRRHLRDLVTLILVDMSASTDAWIEGHRVLDVAKESVLVLGEVLSQYHDRVGIGAFYSHTRRDCRFVMVKEFAAPWSRCKATLASLAPTGYTRIGPALRHGIHLLQQQQATRKLLLLLSDGKPTDYDRYEGRYGIADVRQAIREAGQCGIHTYALAVDVQAKLYLPQMFGPGHYHILPHPSHLVRSLAHLYRRLSL